MLSIVWKRGTGGRSPVIYYGPKNISKIFAHFDHFNPISPAILAPEQMIILGTPNSWLSITVKSSINFLGSWTFLEGGVEYFVRDGMVYYGMTVTSCIIYNKVKFYRCFPTFSVSPFLQFFLLGRSMDSLGQENLIFLQLDINLKVTSHFMFFLYLVKTNWKHLVSSNHYWLIFITCLHRQG